MDRFRMTIGRALTIACAFILATSLSLAADNNAVAPAVATDNTVAVATTWTDDLVKLSEGRLSETRKIATELGLDDTSDPANARVKEWLESYGALQQNRHALITEAYDQYVGWAKQDMQEFAEGDQAGKRGWWRWATGDAAIAYNYTMDEDAFREQQWLKDVVSGALKAAAEYEKDKEWIDAATIYARISEIFPLNKQYRKSLKRCQAHIRIELTYTKDSDWETEVNGIVPEMAVDAFNKIRLEYLRAVEFRDLITHGIEQILRVAEEGSPEVFEAFEDKDSVEEFINRTRVHLKRAEQADDGELDVTDLIRALDNILRINRETELLPEEVVVYEFVQGAFEPLDRFSDMIWPAQLDEFNKQTVGKFCGVGIQIRKTSGDPILVVSPLENSPAYRAGIQPGDLITKINGEPAAPYTISGAVREITGREGTTVNLTFERNGKEFDLKLERRVIVISTVKGVERVEDKDWNFMIDPELKIGYARMTNFTDETIGEMKDVLTNLVEEQDMRGFIFDLRGNPGGTLKAAWEVSNMFLDSHKEIVSTKGRRGEPWSVPSNGSSPFTDFPVIVMVNPSSASASEIVTGALKVHKRALIVGERSFGKGSVQQVFPVTASRDARLKLTTSLYYLPNGRCLHREDDATTWGVDPNVRIKLVPKEENEILKLRLRSEILRGKNQEALSDEEVEKVTTYRSTSKPEDGDENEANGDGDAGDKTPDQTNEATEEIEGDDTTEVVSDKKAVDPNEPELTRKDEIEFPETDPQLEAALLLMRIRLETDTPWPIEATHMAAKNAPASDG